MSVITRDQKLLGRLLFCLVKCKEFQEAVRVGSRLQALGKADPLDLVLTGYAHKMMGGKAKAEQLFEEALERGKGERASLGSAEAGMRRMVNEILAGACFYLADRDVERGQMERALERLRQSVRYCATHENIGNLMYVLLKARRYAELLRVGAAALAKGLEGPGIYYNMACAIAARSAVGDAVMYLTRAARLDPNVVDMAKDDKDLLQIRKEKEFKRFTSRKE